ncbi:MAG TPA: amidohydrolase family protein, partial [Acidimicrobiales bacterium]|nr:amidohydrolase family protein [Acidimicrobiales bacterium]
SHPHLVFAGERSGEFEARVAGAPYDGGGIASTVAATRAAATAALDAGAQRRRRAMWRRGSTTVEAKSGYALDVGGEARLLDVSGRHAEATTFLGAHVVPAEYAGDRDGYVSLVAGSMLDACAPKAQWADVFCDRGAFSVDEARHVLIAARAAGLGLRLHGHQIEATGAVALAVELGAASVDHCTILSARDVDLLGQSSTVATLLPGAELFAHAQRAPGRALVDAGATVALATDCNPGTSFVTSMPLVIALAVAHHGLSCDEALWSATRGGALALRRDDVGALGLGSRADLLVLDAPRAAHLASRPGADVGASVHGADSSSAARDELADQ